MALQRSNSMQSKTAKKVMSRSAGVQSSRPRTSLNNLALSQASKQAQGIRKSTGKMSETYSKFSNIPVPSKRKIMGRKMK